MKQLNKMLNEYDIYKSKMREDDDLGSKDDEFDFDLDGDEERPDTDGEDDLDLDKPETDDEDLDLDDEDDGLDMDDDDVDVDADIDVDDDSDLESRIDDLEDKLSTVLNQFAQVIAGDMTDDEAGEDDDLDLDDEDDDIDADSDEDDLGVDDDPDMGGDDDLDMDDDEEKLGEYADRLPNAKNRDNTDFEADGDFNIKPYGPINKNKLQRRRERYGKHRIAEDVDDNTFLEFVKYVAKKSNGGKSLQVGFKAAVEYLRQNPEIDSSDAAPVLEALARGQVVDYYKRLAGNMRGR